LLIEVEEHFNQGFIVEQRVLGTQMRSLFNRAKRTKVSADWESFKSSKCDYSKMIVIAKRKSRRKFCEDVKSVSKLSSIQTWQNSQQGRLIPFGLLEALPNGEYTISRKIPKTFNVHPFSRV